MKIGELATRAGVSTKTIRYYEDIGVLPTPPRADNGYRVYDTETAERIEFIQDSQAAGLSLVEIQMILELRDSGEPTCGHVVGTLEQHLESVERQMVDLARTKTRLTRLIQDARSMNPAECNDPNRCQTIPRGKK